MAEQENTGSEAAPQKHTFETASPFYNRPASLSVFRAPSTIAGHAVEEPVIPGLEAGTAGVEDANAPPQPGKPGGEPPEDDTKPASTPAPVPRSRGLSLATLLIAAVLGAAAGFASAYVTRHFLDDTQTTLGSLDQRLNAVNAKLAADEKKIDAAGTGRDAVSALEKRLGIVEKTAGDALGMAQAAKTAPAPANSDKPTDSTAPVVVAPMPMPDLAPLQSRIDGLEQRLTKIEATVNTPKIAERATQEPESKPDPAIANAPAIAIIADGLVQKVSSGAPFANELAALERLGADKTKLAALQPSAAKGVATSQALSDQLAALSPALLGTDKPAASAQQEGFFERVMDHAKNLVHVRKVGDLSGDDLATRIARVQNALAHGDADAALKEWAQFPEAAKTASASWAEAAKARLSAVTGAKAIASDAMSNLTKVKS
jgi:hypothetical protein